MLPVTNDPDQVDDAGAFQDDPIIERPEGKAAGAYRTISEVADELAVPQHVLRFWETKFSQLKPLKRGGGRRYYRPEDVDLLRQIHTLLYAEGYTIKGAQKVLKEDRARPDQAMVSIPPVARSVSLGEDPRSVLSDLLEELKALRSLV